MMDINAIVKQLREELAVLNESIRVIENLEAGKAHPQGPATGSQSGANPMTRSRRGRPPGAKNRHVAKEDGGILSDSDQRTSADPNPAD